MLTLMAVEIELAAPRSCPNCGGREWRRGWFVDSLTGALATSPPPESPDLPMRWIECATEDLDGEECGTVFVPPDDRAWDELVAARGATS